MNQDNEPGTKPDFIQGGYILLARKLLSSEIMEKPPLLLKLWVWMLLQASFKDHGGLKRGQFFTRLKDIQKAFSYKAGFRTVKPTIKEIRGSMKILMKAQMMGTMKVLHGMIVTICNYDFYQNYKNYEGHNEGQSQGHNEGTILRMKGRMNEKKDPGAISAEIGFLAEKLFTGENGLYSRMIEAISSTRKTKKLAPGVILSLLQGLEKYPQEKIIAGIQTYLDREYFREGKDEKYLLGIIRNETKKVTQPQAFKSTGSPLLDAYYSQQTDGGQA